MQKCNGHFGYVRLALPALHIGYLKKTIMVLQNICKVHVMPAQIDAGADGFIGLRANTSHRARTPDFSSGPAEAEYR